MDRYVEPFLGGGAVFFYLLAEGRLKSCKYITLCDMNPKLINAWVQVRDDVRSLTAYLDYIDREAEKAYELDADGEFYLKVRARYNDPDVPNLEQAALMLWLNRNGFNGLYRESKRSGYNVPWGQYAPARKLDRRNLLLVNKALKGVSLVCGDFTVTMTRPTPGTLIYCDPPYAKLGDSSFVAYLDKGFDEEQHRRLASAAVRVGEAGGKALVSNSCTPFALELFEDKGLLVRDLVSQTMISRSADTRGATREILGITKHAFKRA